MGNIIVHVPKLVVLIILNLFILYFTYSKAISQIHLNVSRSKCCIILFDKATRNKIKQGIDKNENTLSKRQ